MNAELVAIGTELLLGQIANTNAQRESQALADIGISVYYHTVVGDNLERIVDTLNRALDRSDVVIVTGGLGPTPDDITREAISEVFDAKLVRHDDLEKKIRGVFEGLGRDMPEDNVRQADVPEGANLIEPVGTAPGFWIEQGDRLIFVLPGVPWEMSKMLHEAVIPELRKRTDPRTIYSRHVLVMGLGESSTHDRIRDIVDAQTNPTIAYLAAWGQVRVRITALADDGDEAERLIAPVEKEIRERLGSHAVPGDNETIASALGALLRERGENLAAAESLTGGMIGEIMTETEGSSDYFLGSLVTYSTESKNEVAGVARDVLEGPGAVSEETARLLAEAAVEMFKAHLGVSATGVAGPAEQEGKPPGLIYVGATYKGRTEARKVRGYGDRESIRRIAANSALDLGRRLVQGE
jgi:nicotinamide-nucleotide amidase